MGRRFLCRVLFLALVLSLAAGCGRTEDGAEETDGTAADTAADVNAAAGAEPVGDGTMLTTFEAASLAYETAKQWRSDAVLWWLLPVSAHLDEDWENSDTCFEWDTIFVNRSDDKRYVVYIEGGHVTGAEEDTYFFREIDIPGGIRDERPRLRIKEAGAIAIENHMPRHATPMILYTVENTDEQWNGRPVWEFVFGVGEQYYVIDDRTGELLAVTGTDGQPTEPPAAQEAEKGDPEETAAAFFAALDSGDAAGALALMAESRLENPDNRAMWEASFAAISSLHVLKMEGTFKEEWNAVRQYYVCTLDVTLEPGAQPGLWEEGKITRWITLTLENGRWAVDEISMNP
jgi:hypothetical protein